MNRRSFLKRVAALPLAPLVTKAGMGERLPREDGASNIIIILFDALSARHLSLYGYGRRTAPHLAEFADQAIVYHNHYSSGNFTIPATASLLTGTYPWKHRSFNHAGRMKKSFWKRNLFSLLGNQYNVIAYPHNVWAHLVVNQIRESIDTYLHPTAFALNHDMFYRRLLSGDADLAYRAFEELLLTKHALPGSLFFGLTYSAKGLASELSNLRRFQQAYPKGVPVQNYYHAHFRVEDVVRGMTARLTSAREPFVAYLHFYPPHDPYRPRREFVGIFDDGWRPVRKDEHFFSQGHSQEWLDRERISYDEYIAHVDAEFGRMWESLREQGLARNSYVMLTSDHGELFERGVVRHATPLLYEPLIRVPLVVSTPGCARRGHVYSRTSCVDVLPTLLHLAGLSVPDWCDGQVLPQLGGGDPGNRPVFALEARANSQERPLTHATAAMIRGSYKLVHYFGYPGYEDEYELYDLVNDPEELENLYVPTDSLAEDLRSELSRTIEKANRPYRS